MSFADVSCGVRELSDYWSAAYPTFVLHLGAGYKKLFAQKMVNTVMRIKLTIGKDQ